MQIVSGIAGGIRLDAPKGFEVRPTAVRARKSLFDSLGPLDGLHVADLFAGSGALGLEAASRGAARAVFVDASQISCDCVQENCAKVARAGASCQFHVLRGALPSCSGKALALPRPDIIFADPPYAESAELLKGILEDRLFAKWTEGALLIWEMPDGPLDLDGVPGPWRLRKLRQFGAARFLYLANGECNFELGRKASSGPLSTQ